MHKMRNYLAYTATASILMRFFAKKTREKRRCTWFVHRAFSWTFSQKSAQKRADSNKRWIVIALPTAVLDEAQSS